MAITKEIKLIYADVKDNHNKFWTGELHDNGDVITKWGRVGYGEQSKTFPSAGEHFLHKKEREKIGKGYTPLKTVGNPTAGASTVKVDNLHVIAHQQLSKSNPELAKLVDRLLQANIHSITSQTNITYNASTGLFQTPLGIVTPDGISEARGLLVSIKQELEKSKNPNLNTLVSNYLRLIPQNVGMKFRVESVFPDITAVQKQSDILDSLEASFKAMTSTPRPVSGKSQTIEKVFEVDLGVLSERDHEYDRLVKYYESTKKRMHGYDHVKVRRVYTVKIADMAKSYASRMANQTEVFHGTSQANLLSILKSGLKVSPPSTAYIAGKMFGNGIYGAINSSKSLGYTFGRWGGSSSGDSGWLFICDFAMGKIYYPSGTCRGPDSGYDSVWAKADKCRLNHDELIIYKNEHVNIKYLLECK